MSKRVDNLEKRVSALECQLKSGKEAAEEVYSSWSEVLLEFADRFGLDAQKLRQKVSKGQNAHSTNQRT